MEQEAAKRFPLIRRSSVIILVRDQFQTTTSLKKTTIASQPVILRNHLFWQFHWIRPLHVLTNSYPLFNWQ